MQKIFSLIISICLWQISFSQTVPVDSVKFYEGKEITVCSKVIVQQKKFLQEFLGLFCFTRRIGMCELGDLDLG